MKKYVYLYAIALLLLLIITCKNSDTSDKTSTVDTLKVEQTVNVYSQRHYETDDTLFAMFTRQTGIKVNLIKAKADELINKLEMEGKNSPADLLITVDAERLIRAKEKGLLQPVSSDVLKNVLSPMLFDSSLYWFGITYRARVMVYETGKMKASDFSTYSALADKKWKGKILVRSSESGYNQSLLSSIVLHKGYDEAKKWAAAVVANMAREPKGNDRDQVKALVAGEGSVAIINSYYLALLHNSANKAEREVASKASVFFPNQNEAGTHVNISGMGLAAHSPNKAAAIKLMEFLVSKDAQQFLTNKNYEYPAATNVEPNVLLKSWGSFNADFKALSLLEKHHSEAMKIFNEVGWK